MALVCRGTAARCMVALLSTAAIVGCGSDGGGDDPPVGGMGGTQSGVDAAPTVDAAMNPGDAAPTADAGIPDTMMMAPDAPMMNLPPEPPVLIKPQPSARVFFTIEVEGTAEPDAVLTMRIINGLETVGSRRATVDPGGHFNVMVPYRGASHGDELTVEVIARNNFGSAMRRVQVQHSAPHELAVTLSQAEGSVQGTELIARLYLSPLDDQLPLWVDEQRVTVASGDYPEDQVVKFDAPEGTFIVRAFRDASGKVGPPDGHPTLGGDPQSSGIRATVSNNGGQVELALRAPADPGGRFFGFSAYTFNESALAGPPSVRDGDRRRLGKGQCGGYYLRLQSNLLGQGDALSEPIVALPDLSTVTLADDGACSDAVVDNTSSSFDDEADDGTYFYGLPNPNSADEGRYIMAFRHNDSDQIHVEEDTLEEVIQLPLLRQPIFPLASAANTNLRPTITWQPVPDAQGYIAFMSSRDAWDNNDDEDRLVLSPAYTPNKDLLDDHCYDLLLIAFDDSPLSGDMDAMSIGSPISFCTDVDNDNTIVIDGSISNNTNQNVPIWGVTAISDSEYENRASIRLAPGATDYSLAVLAGDDPEAGNLTAFLDRAETGIVDSLQNNAYTVRLDDRDMTEDVTFDLTFNPPVLSISPAWFERVDATPRFSWSDYNVTAGSAKPEGAFSYVMWTGSESDGGGLPPAAFVVGSDQLHYDLGDPLPATERLDLLAIMSCVEGGGTFSTTALGNPQCDGADMSASASMLQAETLYYWAVIAIECDFSQLAHPATMGVDPFLVCLEDKLENDTIFATSAALPFALQD